MSEEPTKAAARPQPQGQIARNFILLGGGQLLGAILGIAMTASLARTLGPSEYGTYFLIITIAGSVSVLIDWGQASYVVREIARGRSDGACFIGSAALLRTIATAIAAGIAFLVASASGHSSLVIWLALLAVIAAYPSQLVQFLGYSLRGINRTDVDVMAQLLAKALAVFTVILVLYLGGGLVAAVLVPTIGGVVALYYAMRMFARAGLRVGPPARDTMREILVAGAPIVMMSLTIAVQGLIDVTLLTKLTNTTVVGWLGAARAFIGILVSPAMVLATASFPEMCRAAESHPELRKVFSVSARPLLAAGALAACGVFALAYPAVQLVYGPTHFDAAALILQVFAPFFPIFFVNFLLGYMAVAIGKSAQIAIAKVVCVAISAVLSWFLIRHFQASTGNGAIGLMISFCATEILMTIAYVAILPRGLIARSTLVDALRAYLVVGLVGYVCWQTIPLVPLWAGIVLVPSLFAGAAFGVGLLHVSDVNAMRSIVDAFLSRIRNPIR